MSAVASSNRASSATFLLALMVTSSWCLGLASAIPAPDGRRLQQFAATRLPTQLQALSSGAANINQQVQLLLQTVTPQLQGDDLLPQLQQGAASLAAATSQLQATVQGLLAVTDVLAMPTVQATLEALLSQFSMDLQKFAARLQSPPQAGGCFTILQADMLAALSGLTSQLQAAVAGVPATTSFQPQLLIVSLQNMGSDARKVNPCAPGLLVLQSNGQGVLAAVFALIAGIQ